MLRSFSNLLPLLSLAFRPWLPEGSSMVTIRDLLDGAAHIEPLGGAAETGSRFMI